MEKRLKLSKTFIIVCIICIVAGVCTLIYGFVQDPQRTWANYLLNNFYFFLLSIGATFFLALQSITRSGWSSGFRRVSEAMMMYIPLAGILLIFLFFGMQYLYPWSNPDMVSTHEVLQHKSPYLNQPFFFTRLIFFFSIWTLLIFLIRRTSLKEDELGGTLSAAKLEKYAALFIFFLAISFSLIGFDLIMSIEAEWFSTIFSLKSLIAAFQHGTVVIFLIILVLNRNGYFEFFNVSHVHDFARYLFIVSIFYGYFWFSQFMLIWYGNIPEETVYYSVRWTGEWRAFWAADIILNWAIPFFVLLPVVTSRNKWVVLVTGFIVLAGQWVDLFITIFPGTVGFSNIGIIEAGTFLGFAGLFALTTGYHLSRAAVVPVNSPYIKESYQHHFESYI